MRLVTEAPRLGARQSQRVTNLCADFFQQTRGRQYAYASGKICTPACPYSPRTYDGMLAEVAIPPLIDANVASSSGLVPLLVTRDHHEANRLIFVQTYVREHQDWTPFVLLLFMPAERKPRQNDGTRG